MRRDFKEVRTSRVKTDVIEKKHVLPFHFYKLDGHRDIAECH